MNSPHSESLSRFDVSETTCSLPNLKSLTLQSCALVDEQVLSSLPNSLQRLKIAHCTLLYSESLTAYLAKDGSCNLKALILDHNPHLDLAFLPTLRTTCPHLRTLSMDLHYYSDRISINDAEAKYEYLLGADEIPTWPSSLQTLELVHLQKWYVTVYVILKLPTKILQECRGGSEPVQILD